MSQTLDQAFERFAQTLGDALSKAAPPAPATEATSDDTLVAALDGLTKSVSSLGDRLAAVEMRLDGDAGVTKSVEATASDLEVVAEAMERIIDRLEAVEGRSAVSKAAGGDDNGDGGKKSVFGGVIRAAMAGRSVDLA